MQERRPNLSVEVVTFNAFGAQYQVEWVDGKFDPRIANQIAAAHYFIAGDPVTPLGPHIGQMSEYVRDHLQYEAPIPMVSLGGDGRLGWRVHGVDALEQAIVSQKRGTAVAQPKTIDLRPYARPARAFVLTYQIARIKRDGIQIARRMIELRNNYRSHDYNYIDWLTEEIFDLHQHFVAMNNKEGLAITSPVVCSSSFERTAGLIPICV
jgi:hypothetical protein